MPLFNGPVMLGSTYDDRSHPTMRRTVTLLVGLAAGVLTFGLGASAASANTDPVPPDPSTPVTAAPITSTDTLPSCSLHPTRNDDGTVTFTNANHERRFLQVFDAAGGFLYNGWLEVGASTGPLVNVHNVIWSGHAYPLSAYDLVAWCAEDVTPPPATTVPPTTVPPVTAPPTTVPPTTTPPPPTTVAEPQPPTTEPPTTVPADDTEDSIPVGVEAVVVTRETMPVTGAHPGVLVLLGASLMVMGAGIVTAGRRRTLAR